MWLVLGSVIAIGAVVGFAVLTDQPPTQHFCDTSLSIQEVTVAGARVLASLEDQGGPGRDGCDISEAPRIGSSGLSGLVVGYDCKVRAGGGEVVAEVSPDRPDGTCGQ